MRGGMFSNLSLKANRYPGNDLIQEAFNLNVDK